MEVEKLAGPTFPTSREADRAVHPYVQIPFCIDARVCHTFRHERVGKDFILIGGKKNYSRWWWVKRGMESGCWVPESGVRMAGEGREGGGELHRVEEGVGRLLLVRHRSLLAAIQGLPTSQVLLWLRLQSSESAGWGAGPPVYLGTWPPPNTGPLLPTGFPLTTSSSSLGCPPSTSASSLTASFKPLRWSLSSGCLLWVVCAARGAPASQSHIPLSKFGPHRPLRRRPLRE